MPLVLLSAELPVVDTSIAEVKEAIKRGLLNMQHIFGQLVPVLRPVLRR